MLELDLPDVDGCEALAVIKQVSDVPVVAIAASGGGRRLGGLRAGADACVSSREDPSAVIARIGSLIRRDRSGGEDRDAIEDDFVRIDRADHRVTVAGVEVALTLTEFRLLEAFAENPGLALPHEDLLDSVWGNPGPRRAEVELYVRYLRRKLAVGLDPIETVRGVGYRYAPRRIETDGTPP